MFDNLSLEFYFERFRKLFREFPEDSCWSLLAVADDVCRGEHMDRVRRDLKDRNQDYTWGNVFVTAAGDSEFWDHYVRRPALKMIATNKTRPTNPDQDDVNGLRRALGIADPYTSTSSSTWSGHDGSGGSGGGLSKTQRRKRNAEAKAQNQLNSVITKIQKESHKGWPKGEGKGGKTGRQTWTETHPKGDAAGRFVTTESGNEICFKFRAGTCSDPCPLNRMHVCQDCLQPHRACVKKGRNDGGS